VARQFRKHYGTTIGEFVRQTRIEYARHRLCNSDLSTVEIALESGFAHQAHFSNVFKKVMGMTPGRYCAAMGVTRRRRAGLPVVAMSNHYPPMKGFKGRDLAS
jgi:AraC-like DNA-binding protein